MHKSKIATLSLVLLVASCNPPASPTENPGASPSPSVSPSPTEPQPSPSVEPSTAPEPTAAPTSTPTPTAAPTVEPEPTPEPTMEPTPTPEPTVAVQALLEFERFKLLAGTGETGTPETGMNAEEVDFPSTITAIDVDQDDRIWLLNGGPGILGEITPEIVRTTSQDGDIKYRLYWERIKGLQQNTGMVYDAQKKLFYLARKSVHQIISLDPATAEITILAGTGASGYNGDRDALEAQINQPTDVTVDSKGNIYFTDTGNHLIRKITPDGKLITVAGQYVQDTRTEDEDDVPSFEPLGATTGDGGPAREARLKSPTYLTVDQNDALYFSSDSDTIRRIANDQIDRYVGSGQSGYNGDNFRATLVHLNKPQDLTFGADGQLYFIDRGNYRIRRTVNVDGELRVQDLVGNGRYREMVDALSDPLAAELDPVAMNFDTAGNLVVYDVAHKRIRRLEVKK